MHKSIAIKPISEIPDQLCADLEFVFTDIDDTITKDGMMPSETLKSMHQLYDAGIKIVLVTGGPAGWCDYFARMWPIAGVIGENGAFYFSFDSVKKKMRRKFLITEKEIKQSQKKLEVLRKKILLEVEGCRISVDQIFRITDLAIDIGRDGEPLSKEKLEKLYAIIDHEGAERKTSSVHVNCWYGAYNKLAGYKVFMDDFSGLSSMLQQKSVIYVGDAPNDEPMFEGLRNTVAVANIKKYLSAITHKPAFITEAEAADGFSEFVKVLLDKRSRKG